MLKLRGGKLLAGNPETKKPNMREGLIKVERRGWGKRRKKYITIENLKHSVKIKFYVAYNNYIDHA